MIETSEKSRLRFHFESSELKQPGLPRLKFKASKSEIYLKWLISLVIAIFVMVVVTVVGAHNEGATRILAGTVAIVGIAGALTTAIHEIFFDK